MLHYQLLVNSHPLIIFPVANYSFSNSLITLDTFFIPSPTLSFLITFSSFFAPCWFWSFLHHSNQSFTMLHCSLWGTTLDNSRARSINCSILESMAMSVGCQLWTCTPSYTIPGLALAICINLWLHGSNLRCSFCRGSIWMLTVFPWNAPKHQIRRCSLKMFATFWWAIRTDMLSALSFSYFIKLDVLGQRLYFWAINRSKLEFQLRLQALSHSPANEALNLSPFLCSIIWFAAWNSDVSTVPTRDFRCFTSCRPHCLQILKGISVFI